MENWGIIAGIGRRAYIQNNGPKPYEKEFKMLRKLCFALLLIGILNINPVMADYDPRFKIEIPDSVKALDSPLDLKNFINSENPKDRIVACKRLGQIKGKSAYNLLVEAFNNEAGDPSIEAPRGVKYYAPLNIARTGVPQAEDFLKELSTKLAGQIEAIPQGFVSTDIISALEGSFNGLLELGTGSSIDFLHEVFNNERYYWLIRQIAHMNISRYELKRSDYATASDTTDFLLDIFMKAGGEEAMYDSTGNIDVNFILRSSSKFLLYDYSNTILPYLSNYILQLKSDDPMLPMLRKMETNMINNPPWDTE
jgi:hypothetical protein